MEENQKKDFPEDDKNLTEGSIINKWNVILLGNTRGWES